MEVNATVGKPGEMMQPGEWIKAGTGTAAASGSYPAATRPTGGN